ncbi:MAG: glycosyl transferase [Desulfatitalea sp. BRH_c12]|nr:MAG: glycosyl transferase [Desulfatitalea sp. BRH_c12]
MIYKNECGPRLSILLVTYNHEKYIEKAINSIFFQTLEGPVELVIADDGSSDNTLTIIREHEGRDPRFQFKYLDGNSNIGITRNYQRGFAACTGTYVAVLEGDDYWVSSLKLKHQCDFLDNFYGCDLCSVNYFVYQEDQASFTIRTAIGNGHRFISARELIADNIIGNFSTCMYRKSGLEKLPPAIFSIKSYDWIVNICIARYSLIGFLEEPMSVYRLHSNGVWAQKPHVEKLKEQLGLIPAYDELTMHIFKNDFENLSNCLKHNIITSSVEDAVADTCKPFARILPNILDFMPPIILTLSRSLLPPKLKRSIVRIFFRGVA